MLAKSRDICYNEPNVATKGVFFMTKRIICGVLVVVLLLGLVSSGIIAILG